MSSNASDSMDDEPLGSSDDSRMMAEADGDESDGGRRRKKQKSSEEIEISSKYDFEDSDITIISSDLVHFKVHSFMLKQVSLMFKNSLPTSAPPLVHDPVVLTDRFIESSEVIEALLDLIYSSHTHDLRQAQLYRNVICLARKWECLHALISICDAIDAHLVRAFDHSPPNHLFVIAVGLEDPTLLARVVRHSSSQRWHHTWNELDYIGVGIPAKYKENAALSDGLCVYPHIFDFGAWSLDDYLSLPPIVIRCLYEARAGSSDRARLNHNLETDTFELAVSYYYQPKEHTGHRSLTATINHRRNAPCLSRCPAYSFPERWSGSCDGDIAGHFRSRRTPLGQGLGNPETAIRHNYEDADIILISSDDISFNVHASMLARASEVLADMLEIGQSASNEGLIALTDAHLEHNMVVKAILDVIYRFRAPHLSQVTLILYMIDLANKWEADIVLEVVKKNIEAAFCDRNVRQFDLFLIAIKLDAIGLAQKVIELEDTAIDCGLSRDVPPGDLPLQVYDRSRFHIDCYDMESSVLTLTDISSAGLRDFIQLPPKIAWALQRASLMWDHGLKDEDEPCLDRTEEIARHRAIAENFRRVMDPSYEPIRKPPLGCRGYQHGYEEEIEDAWAD